MGTLSFLITGTPTGSSVPISAKTSSASNVRIKVGTNSGLTAGVAFTAMVAPDSSGYSHHTVTGLTAGTHYWYQAEVDGALDTSQTGEFITDSPKQARSFRVAFGSCLTTTNANGTAFNNMLANGAEMLIHLGDWHYRNDTSTSQASHVTDLAAQVTSNSGFRNAIRRIPVAYTYSDHDSGTNDWTGGPAAWTPATNAAYRQVIPVEGTLPSGGVYRSFARGRVKFILTDGRSYKSPAADADNSSKTMFGFTQEAWIANELADPDYPVKVICLDVPWVFATTAGSDKWGGYTAAAQRLVDAINAAKAQVWLIHGDAHSLCADNGSSPNNRGSLPVSGAAPFGNTTSVKGGPYSQGTYAPSNQQEQHGLLDVTDNGSTITIRYSGRDTSNTERVTLSHTFTAPSSGTVLAAPTGLTVTAASSSELDVSWSAVSGATGYDVERNGAIITTGTTDTTWLDLGLTAATVYTYRVRARNATTVSDWTAAKSGTTQGGTGPGLSGFGYSPFGTSPFGGTGTVAPSGAYRGGALLGDGQTATTTTITGVIPTAAQAGDVAIIHLDTVVNTGTFDTPAGWTLLSGPDRLAADTNTGYVFGRTLADGDAGSTVTFTYSESRRIVGTLTVWSGVTLTGALIAAHLEDSPSTGAGLPAEAAETASVVVALWGREADSTSSPATVTVPAPFTAGPQAQTGYTAAPNVTARVGYVVTSTAGLYGGQTATTSSDTIGVSYLLVLPPLTQQGSASGSWTVTGSAGGAQPTPTRFRAGGQIGNGQSVTGTTVTATIPAQAQDGDVALVALESPVNTGTFATPAGWQLLSGPVRLSVESHTSYLFARELTGSDAGSTVDFVYSESRRLVGTIAVFAGVSLAGATVASAVDETLTTTLTVPTLNEVSAGAMIVAVWGRETANTFGPNTPTSVTVPPPYTAGPQSQTAYGNFAELTSTIGYRPTNAGDVLGDVGTFGGETSNGAPPSIGVNRLVSLPIAGSIREGATTGTWTAKGVAAGLGQVLAQPSATATGAWTTTGAAAGLRAATGTGTTTALWTSIAIGDSGEGVGWAITGRVGWGAVAAGVKGALPVVGPLPAAVQYGTVTWQAVSAVADGPDVDGVPDAVAVTGTVIFTPSAKVLLATETKPVTVIATPVTYDLGLDGVLRDAQGRTGVMLVATDSPGITPTGWTWQVSYKLNKGLSRGSFSFALPSGSTVDLTTVAPVDSSNGTPIIQGPAGASAYDLAVSEGFVGTETDWLASLTGPMGPQGNPGPAGPGVTLVDNGDGTFTLTAV